MLDVRPGAPGRFATWNLRDGGPYIYRNNANGWSSFS